MNATCIHVLFYFLSILKGFMSMNVRCKHVDTDIFSLI